MASMLMWQLCTSPAATAACCPSKASTSILSDGMHEATVKCLQARSGRLLVHINQTPYVWSCIKISATGCCPYARQLATTVVKMFAAQRHREQLDVCRGGKLMRLLTGDHQPKHLNQPCINTQRSYSHRARSLVVLTGLHGETPHPSIHENEISCIKIGLWRRMIL